MKKTIKYIAFRSYEGPTLIAKVSAEGNSMNLVEYKDEYVDFDQSRLNQDSEYKLNGTVYAQNITEITEEEYKRLKGEKVEQKTVSKPEWVGASSFSIGSDRTPAAKTDNMNDLIYGKGSW